MIDQYSGHILRVVIAQICKSAGYDKIQPSSLAVMQDTLHNFLKQFCRDLHAATEHANRTEASFKDLMFCFGIQNITPGDLIGFLNRCDPVPCPMNILPYPVSTKNSLTLLDTTGMN